MDYTPFGPTLQKAGYKKVSDILLKYLNIMTGPDAPQRVEFMNDRSSDARKAGCDGEKPQESCCVLTGLFS